MGRPALCLDAAPSPARAVAACSRKRPRDLAHGVLEHFLAPAAASGGLCAAALALGTDEAAVRRAVEQLLLAAEAARAARDGPLLPANASPVTPDSGGAAAPVLAPRGQGSLTQLEVPAAQATPATADFGAGAAALRPPAQQGSLTQLGVMAAQAAPAAPDSGGAVAALLPQREQGSLAQFGLTAAPATRTAAGTPAVAVDAPPFPGPGAPALLVGGGGPGSLTQLGMPAAQVSPASHVHTEYEESSTQSSVPRATDTVGFGPLALGAHVHLHGVQGTTLEVRAAAAGNLPAAQEAGRHWAAPGGVCTAAPPVRSAGSAGEVAAQRMQIGNLHEFAGARHYIEGEIQRRITFRDDRGFSVRVKDTTGAVDIKFLGVAAHACRNLALHEGAHVRLEGWELFKIAPAYLRHAPQGQQREVVCRRPPPCLRVELLDDVGYSAREPPPVGDVLIRRLDGPQTPPILRAEVAAVGEAFDAASSEGQPLLGRRVWLRSPRDEASPRVQWVRWNAAAEGPQPAVGEVGRLLGAAGMGCYLSGGTWHRA
uniref:Uncharacterized protein n=1 Tax=Alexandrium monilatum TaxID=311494 RepID=A0A7S4VCY8_9DINO